MTDKEKRELKDGVKNLIGKYKVLEHGIIEVLENNILFFIDSMQEEPVSEELENVAIKYAQDKYMPVQTSQAFKAGSKWQKEQDKETIELAEDHAYFAGRTKTIDEINKALLSEVLPCFMHGGEADEVVAKLDEVLNQKK